VNLVTPRLILRPPVEEDLPAPAAIHADPEVMRFWPRPYTLDESREVLAWMMKQHREHGYGLCATIDRETGAFIGRCGLLRQEIDGELHLEVGYMLARSHWGRGLATEAARASAGYAFRELGVGHVISLIQPANVASIRVAERNGMRPVREID
jgi:ribosomal-protein-alanine N-acetyltransferase